jgi:FHA domain
LLAGVFLLVRAFSREKRTCPTCRRPMKDSQIECPYCTGTVSENIPGDGTQEIQKASAPMSEEEFVPLELLEKKPDFDTSITKTFVLMETPVLVIRKGKNIGQTFSLNRIYPVSIGRSRVNEIRLDDAAVSGQHCRILPENGKHVLYDLSSTNGTFVNDKKVSKESLKEGDILRIGETQFLYRVEQHGA